MGKNNLNPAIVDYIKSVISEVTEIDSSRLNIVEPLESYGINSTMIFSLNAVLQRKFNDLPRTLFFEYKTIAELTNYFSEHYSTEFISDGFSKDVYIPPHENSSDANAISPPGLNSNTNSINAVAEPVAGPSSQLLPAKLIATADDWFDEIAVPEFSIQSQRKPADIAIIGIAGRYPGARNLREFWSVLYSGIDCVTEVPASRWNHDAIFSESTDAENKVFARWGGFIEDYDGFDNRFFNVSPKEARKMDPQERLFLQTAWNTFEDAGYTRSQLSGSQVGVYVGAMWSQYQLHAAERCSLDNLEAASSSFSSIANRVSYFFNLHGPSIALDTMCSSSISAIHMACQSLLSGESSMAIAGGVNICSHPAKYIHLCEGRFAAIDGRCRAFGEGGTGYVPGEGVGAVLLKPLAQALMDGDIVHGVIKASALNHGGKTNGYTVPNPVAQAALISAALEKSGVSAEDISVVEAHGTGTSLGDPIEIAGLLSGFGDDFNPRGNCVIGSVKSNIGHLESAAGIAGLTKLLLQMRHKTLVPSLHSVELNKNINWNKVPFTVQQKLEPWRGKSKQPVYAALSAFGAGGSNGHLVLSSHVTQPSEQSRNPQLLVVSATNNKSLELMCRELAEVLGTDEEMSLADIAYTLQVGREAFSQRVAIQADNIEHAAEQFKQIAQSLATNEKDPRVATAQGAAFAELMQGDVGDQFMQQLFNASEWDSIARLWLGGAAIDWSRLIAGMHKDANIAPRKVSLPGYVFDTRPFNLGAPVWLSGPSEASATSQPATIADDGGTMNINRQIWRSVELQKQELATPTYGVIISHPETQGVAQQLREQFGFSHFDIVYPEETKTADFFESLALKRSDSFSIIHLWGNVFDTAENPIPQEYSYAAEQMLNIRTLLKTRCALRYLWVNLGDAATLTRETAKLARGFTTALCGEYKQFIAASLDTSQQGIAASAVIAKVWNSFNVAQQYREINGEIQQRVLEPVAIQPGIVPVDANKCHVITGGTGGIGLQIAQWLMQRGAGNIILCGRQTLPDRAHWQALLGSSSTDASLRIKLRGLQELPSTVKAVSLDLDSASAVTHFFHELRQRDELGYVFHCAGIADEDSPLFMEKTPDSIDRVFSPKVMGTDNLLSALQHSDCDRVVFISSLASVCPRLSAGLVDYAVANSYLNALAEDQPLVSRQHQKSRVVSVLMPNWREVGLGETRSPHYLNLGLKSVSNRQGIALLEQSLLCDGSVVLPLYVDKNFQLERITTLEPINSGTNTIAQKAVTENVAAVNTKVLQTIEPVADINLVSPIPVPEKDSVSSADIISELKVRLAPVLGMTATDWKDADEFSVLGVDSVLLAAMATQIEKWLSVPFSADILLDHTSLVALADYLQRDLSVALDNVFTCEPMAIAVNPVNAVKHEPAAEPIVEFINSKPFRTQINFPVQGGAPESIAIVGMGAIFPGANDIHAYWDNLSSGHSAIGEVPSSRWDIQTIFNPTGNPGESISKWGGFVEGVEYFSPSQFGLPDEIGADADPLLRLAMRATDAALRDAGISVDAINGGNVGVFMGSRVSTYAERIPRYGRNTILGTAQNFIAAHISHWLNLRGPALVLDSACSSSLLSIHLACQSLRDGECDIALAGGSEYLLDETPYQMLSQAKALSPTGKCRTFDADADGFVPGEGAGVVVLKKLSQALIDGDRIYALVNGSAVNNDGRTMGVTTPNPEAQQDVIRKALAKAGFSADDIGYVEAHGTGTRLGDPMELKALTEVFRQQTERRQYCAIGSVKSNMGHLLSAAGVASVIKVAFSIYHKTLVPTLNCNTPNPRFNFSDSPFFPSDVTRSWKPDDNCCRAGISAFGFGGTNVHVLLSDTHLAQAYRPVKTPLPLVANSGPYLWHHQSAKSVLMKHEADGAHSSDITQAPESILPIGFTESIGIQQEPAAPVASNRSFNWKRTA